MVPCSLFIFKRDLWFEIKPTTPSDQDTDWDLTLTCLHDGSSPPFPLNICEQYLWVAQNIKCVYFLWTIRSGSYLACGGKRCQSLVAVKKRVCSFCPQWLFWTAAGDCCNCVAAAAFEALIKCGGNNASLLKPLVAVFICPGYLPSMWINLIKLKVSSII